MYSLVNTGLLLVKCYLIESKEEAHDKSHQILQDCKDVLQSTICSDTREIKKRLYENQRRRLDQYNVGEKEERSSKMTAAVTANKD